MGLNINESLQNKTECKWRLCPSLATKNQLGEKASYQDREPLHAGNYQWVVGCVLDWANVISGRKRERDSRIGELVYK